METLHRLFDFFILGEGIGFGIIFTPLAVFLFIIQTKRFIDLMKILFTKPVPVTKPIIATGRSVTNANINVRKKVIVSKMRKYRELLVDKSNGEDMNDYLDTNVILNELDELLSINLKTQEEVELAEFLFNDGKFRTEKEKRSMMKKIQQKNFNSEELQYESLVSIMKREVRLRGVNDAIMSLTIPYVGTLLVFPIAFTIIFVKTFLLCTYEVETLGNLISLYPLCYCTSFPIHLGINYILYGSLNIAAEHDYQNEITEIYSKAGKKPPMNKNIIIQSGLYALSVGMLFRSVRKGMS